jgi:uncharacterized protein
VPRILLALAAGLIFGLGLTISQMINPAKVLGFLDLFGDWDPSLALVMVGAIPAAAVGYRLAGRSSAPLFAEAYAAPARSAIDGRLIGGAILFGIGWGLVGYCPGPALASIAVGSWRTVLFVAAMLLGMAGFSALQSITARRLRRA